jgi:chaperone modulatory protein CbpM
MVKHEITIVADYSQDSSLTLVELCEICNITSEVVNDFIAYEIIHPQASQRGQWIFNLNELRRIKTALRLQHDLEINLAGVGLVLDLLEELEELREQKKFLERHF